MTLCIRQIVVAAADLEAAVEQFGEVLGVRVAYRDPNVAEFGLVNAVMVVGDQFLEVVSPTQPNTAAGRHLDRHRDSGYMLLLQTDDFGRDRARLEALKVRTVWQAERANVRAMHLHPKDIGAAIVSLDQPLPPESWPWAGDHWQEFTNPDGALRVVSATVGAVDCAAMARRWAQVLDAAAPEAQGDGYVIHLAQGELRFEPAEADVITGFGVAMRNPDAALATARELELDVRGNAVRQCGTWFRLLPLGS